MNHKPSCYTEQKADLAASYLFERNDNKYLLVMCEQTKLYMARQTKSFAY